jgi:hypothetical protein
VKLQLLSDLHLETETFDPEPAPGAELLVLAGDIDATWAGLARFAGWPVPVIFVPGNHEFDGRAFEQVLPDLSALCQRLGIRLLHRESLILEAADGRRVRFVCAVRWSDFDLFGSAQRERAKRAAAYFMRLMAATRGDRPFDADGVREEGLACRAWLEQELTKRPGVSHGSWDRTVVHFAPSLKSATPAWRTARHSQLLQRRRRPDCRPTGRTANCATATGGTAWPPPARGESVRARLAHKGEAEGLMYSRLIEI